MDFFRSMMALWINSWTGFGFDWFFIFFYLSLMDIMILIYDFIFGILFGWNFFGFMYWVIFFFYYWYLFGLGFFWLDLGWLMSWLAFIIPRGREAANPREAAPRARELMNDIVDFFFNGFLILDNELNLGDFFVTFLICGFFLGDDWDGIIYFLGDLDRWILDLRWYFYISFFGFGFLDWGYIHYYRNFDYLIARYGWDLGRWWDSFMGDIGLWDWDVLIFWAGFLGFGR